MKDESLKSLVSRLYEEIRSAGECVDLLQNAFIYSSAKFLDECEARAKEIHRNEKILTEALVEESKKDPQAKVYVPVPGHIERIGDYIESICGCTRTKIREDILFSDKAISEVAFLLQRILDVLKNANDLIQSVDPQGRFLYVNKAWKDSLGFSEEELKDLTLFDIIHPDGREQGLPAFRKALSGEKIDRIEAESVYRSRVLSGRSRHLQELRDRRPAPAPARG